MNVRITMPLTRCHPRTGERVWSNTLQFAVRPFQKRCVALPSGCELDKASVNKEITEAYLRTDAVEFQWAAGTEYDMLLIDNYKAIHAGPMSWTGQRKMMQVYGFTTPPTAPLFPA